MRILIACEESQTVCKAFREKGHEAYSCDLQPCSGGHPEWHIWGDVLNVLNPSNSPPFFFTADGTAHDLLCNWDMIIAHPPCTYISKAGARFMFPTAGVIDSIRFEKALKAKEFFLQIMNADCNKICIENPTPLKIVGLPEESQVIQPYYFGHPYSKRTLLWLKGLPPLIATNILNYYTPYLPSNTSKFYQGHGGSHGVAHSAKASSKTFEGIASAMADQWG